MAIRTANNQSLTEITSLPSGVSGGAMILLETQTASSSATLSFTSDIDDTYDEYVFRFYNIHPATGGDFTFQVDTGTNTSYNQTITSTFHQAYHSEDDTSNTILDYRTTGDQAQGSAFQKISGATETANDDNLCGYLHLFSPSSSVFVKHFMTATQTVGGAEGNNAYVAGYVNTTTALTRVQFKMASGNIDAGVIKLYGIS